VQYLAPETFYVLGALVLGVVIAWAAFRYMSRNRRLDEVREEATRQQYDHPDTYGRGPDAKRSDHG
jgi:hypothetical protein